MEILFILLPASLALALLALIGFLWSTRSGQLRDLDTPAKRILFEEADQAPSSSEPDEGSSNR